MAKKRIVFKCFLIAWIIVLLCFEPLMLMIGVFRNNLKGFFDELEPVSDPGVAFAVQLDGVLALKDSDVRMETETQFSTFSSAFVCVYKEWIYFVGCRVDDSVLLRKQKQTGEEQVLCTIPRGYPEIEYPRPYYDENSNGIILSYEEDVYVFSMETEDLVRYGTEDFVHPEKAYAVTKLSDQEIVVSDGVTSRHITLSYMARRHEYAKRIQELPSHFWLLGMLTGDTLVEPTNSFFHSTYVIENSVYLTCVVRDKEGQRNYIVFSYDYATDKFEYLFHRFISKQEIYPIPIVP